jgi:hydroxymethylpyrimidine pyrophosphatase-like HAD family hydrolase
VDAVVGENGAFTFFMDQGVRRRIDTPAGKFTATECREKLKVLGEKIRARFPQAVWASDQSYREFDLAIDICEDVPHWSKADVEALLKLCNDEGAHAKLSSIHVNTWFGDYDKIAGIRHWLKNSPVKMPEESQLLFIGDSPNDEPLFANFKFSVGVANLAQYLDRLKSPPRWITSNESGAGFAEMAARLVKGS